MQLDAIPEYPDRLFELLIDPDRGGCDPGSSRKLIDPSVEVLKSEVRAAVQRAAAERATLVFAYVGHGDVNEHKAPSPLYLLPSDADPDAPTGDTAYEIGHHLADQPVAQLDGLIVLLDVCHAGKAARDVITSSLATTQQVRLEMVAGTFLRVARRACFTGSLIQLMDTGLESMSVDFFGVRDIANQAADLCRGVQDAPMWVGAGHGLERTDPGLWITRNIAGGWLLSGTAEGGVAVALTVNYQLTGDVQRVQQASWSQQIVPVIGGAGTGKSTLFAALARPELVSQVVPARFLSALAFTTLTPTLDGLAQTLHRQLLKRTGFPTAETQYRARHADELDQIPALERLVFGPLRLVPIPAFESVRIAIDGVDRLDEATRTELLRTLREIPGDPDLTGVRVLFSSRTHDPDLLPAAPVRLTRPSREELSYYLTRLQIPDTAGTVITETVDTWLDAQLSATVATLTDASALEADTAIEARYDQLLTLAEQSGPARATLTVLAAAGTGPLLPLHLAVAAITRLGNTTTIPDTRDTLTRLGQLITRTQPGTSQEHTGLAHDTLTHTLHQHWPDQITTAHHALITEIQATLDQESDDHATAENAITEETIAEYATKHLPDHYWAIGSYTDAVTALEQALTHNPADNLNLLAPWNDRATTNPNHPATLTLRAIIATITAQAGNLSLALSQFEQLLTDQIRILGPGHPDTLRTRSNIASWTGRAGDISAALTQFQQLLTDRIRILGPDHPDTLNTRSDIAYWTAEAGDITTALSQSQQLVTDQTRILGSDHPETLIARSNIASWTAGAGDIATALSQFEQLLTDRIRILGPDHPNTLTTRNNIAYSTAEAGDITTALTQFEQLLTDQTRILGPDHPRTLRTRNNIAIWTGRAGAITTALTQFEQLLTDQTRILAPDHPDTLTTRGNIAALTGQAGDITTALAQAQQLLTDQTRIQGPDHPDTLRTRNNIASWTVTAEEPAT